MTISVNGEQIKAEDVAAEVERLRPHYDTYVRQHGSEPDGKQLDEWAKENIVERMAVSPDDAWDVPGPGKPLPPDRSRKSEYTEFILKGRFDTSDVDRLWLNEFMKKHGLTEKDLKVGE